MIAKDFSSKVLLHWLLFNLETCSHRFRGLFLYLYFETEIMEQIHSISDKNWNKYIHKNNHHLCHVSTSISWFLPSLEKYKCPPHIRQHAKHRVHNYDHTVYTKKQIQTTE